MLNSLKDCVKLNNGVEMPKLGLGVFKMETGQEVIDAIKYAVDAGYKLIDTAAIYKNEDGVGTGIKECSVPREELFITSKVWNSEQGYDSTLKAFEKTMEDLQLTYLDLYLIHWPLPNNKNYVSTWKALEKLYKEGRIRAIGVSNFEPEWIEDILSECEVVPMVNQVECHPYLQQDELLEYCNSKGIVLQAWSPLAQGEILGDEKLAALAEKYGKTVAQFVIRWVLQRGITTIPKSIKQDRIISNADVYDFEISPEDMEAMKSFDIGKRVGPDPSNFYVA